MCVLDSSKTEKTDHILTKGVYTRRAWIFSGGQVVLVRLLLVHWTPKFSSVRGFQGSVIVSLCVWE